MAEHLPDYFFITICTDRRFPFLAEDIFAEITIDNLIFAARLKSFAIHGYKVNPEHIHIIMQKRGSFAIGQFLHSFKRPTSLQINQLITYRREGESVRLLKEHRIKNFQKRMIEKYGSNNLHEFPVFKWQRDAHVFPIRSRQVLKRCINYLRIQAEKHQLAENKWLYISDIDL